MRSGSGTFQWVRPLQSIVCLLGGKVVPFEIAGLESSNTTRGHRFHGNQPFAVKSPLDEIDGIGPTRKRALLSHFGSAKAVSRAGIGDLQAVKGISEEMAQKIYDFFNERHE